jgi:hypothetical protein
MSSWQIEGRTLPEAEAREKYRARAKALVNYDWCERLKSCPDTKRFEIGSRLTDADISFAGINKAVSAQVFTTRLKTGCGKGGIESEDLTLSG